MDDLKQAIRARGGRVTPQRVLLLEALRRLGRHSTAEEVRAAAGDRLPQLSLPTVYATLDLFIELGLARRVNAGGGAIRYDPRVEQHDHFACRNCGNVVDLEPAIDDTPARAAARVAGHRPEGSEILVVGLCRDCARSA
jgi:Fe2+ or Zn2+ uptake regulation protein